MFPYTTYLIDLDGVIYRGESLLPGAKNFIEWLDATHKKYLFLTNNSFASEDQVIEKLKRLGITTDESHVLGAGQASVQYIARRFPHGRVYVVGEPPLVQMVREYGLQPFDLDETQKMPSKEPRHTADAVLVGLDRTFDYKKITGATLAVRGGAAFIAINRDPLLPIESGVIPGCGAMVAAIEASSETHPEVIGKPQPGLLLEAMHKLSSSPDETVMIGDGLDTDIAGGLAAHTHTIFVLSGKDTRASLEKSPYKPEKVYENIAAVLKNAS